MVAEHPAVAQVGVIGTPDDRWGEAVTAEIQRAAKDKKGSVHSPKQVIFTDLLPLTGLGKADKKALRAQYWEGCDRAV